MKKVHDKCVAEDAWQDYASFLIQEMPNTFKYITLKVYIYIVFNIYFAVYVGYTQIV